MEPSSSHSDDWDFEAYDTLWRELLIVFDRDWC